MQVAARAHPEEAVDGNSGFTACKGRIGEAGTVATLGLVGPHEERLLDGEHQRRPVYPGRSPIGIKPTLTGPIGPGCVAERTERAADLVKLLGGVGAVVD